jgi:acyl transferase domain-containing protein
MTSPQHIPFDIAIIGIACRFPGAESPAAFWRLLEEGRDGIGEIPPGRFDIDRYYHPDPNEPGTIYTRRGGFLSEIEGFDAAFFGMPPSVARTLDPQQRLALETAREALEDAAIAPATLKNSLTGVFVGAAENEYGRRVFSDPKAVDVHGGPGNIQAFAAGRIAYTLGLQGQTQTVHTACSSSLVAIHNACQTLRLGECDLAIAGGVQLILGPDNYLFLSRAKTLSRDGMTRAFDADADGFCRGEGAGMVMLRRLGDAEQDGDNILAVIRASAVNNDGPSGGLIVPNVQAQERLLRTALERADLDPGEVGYLEANGTATLLGDPLELQAAGKVYVPGRAPERPLYLGSVKANLGHLEAAAGVASLIKAVLAIRHGKLPPQPQFRTPNPRIPWARLPFQVVTKPTPWPNGPRIAGVSSFGMSGTNAHLLIEGYPETALGENWTASLPEEPRESPSPRGRGVGVRARRSKDAPRQELDTGPLPLSAKSLEALHELAARYREWLDANPNQPLADITLTAAIGRDHFAHRAALRASTRQELREQLDRLAQRDPRIPTGKARPGAKVSLLFSDQGELYSGMGQGLLDTLPAFRQKLEACAELLDEQLETPLRELLFEPGQDARLNRPRNAHPARFAYQVALFEGWRSIGIGGDALLGMGDGEIAAAHAAGVFSLEDGLRLAAAQGQVAEGAMTKDALTRFIEGLDLQPPRRPLISARAGAPLGADDATNPSFWGWRDDEPGNPDAARDTLSEQGCELLLEIGPASPFAAAIAEGGAPIESPRLIPSPRPVRDEFKRIRDALAELYIAGMNPDWRAWHAPFGGRRSQLPSYPFQRKRYWLELVNEDSETPQVRKGESPSPRGRGVGVRAATRTVDQPPPLAAPPREDRENLTAIPRDLPPAERKPLLEHRLREELRQLLGLDAQPDADADLFALGMDSLKAVELRNRIDELIGEAAELPFTLVLDYPSVAQLAEQIEKTLETASPPANSTGTRPPAATSRQDPPLSFAQEALWYSHRHSPRAYRIWSLPIRYRISGELDATLLEQSLSALAARHDSLRTRFPEQNGAPIQWIMAPAPTSLARHDISALMGDRQAERLEQLIQEETRQPLDLIEGPLWRASLIRLAADRHLLLIYIHHIIADAASMEIFASELSQIYSAIREGKSPSLPPLPFQYPDFSAWQRAYFTREVLEDRLTRYRQLTDPAPPPLTLPIRADGAIAEMGPGGLMEFTITPQRTQALEALSQRSGATLFTTLCAAYSLLLHGLSGCEEILLALPMNRRYKKGAERLIGYFSGQGMLRLDLSGNPPFEELLGRTRCTVSDALQHQDLAYPQVLSGLKREGHEAFGQNLPYQAGFNFLPVAEEGYANASFRIATVHDFSSEMRRHLALFLRRGGTRDRPSLAGNLQYRRDLFERRDVIGFVEAFQAILTAISRDPARKLEEVLQEINLKSSVEPQINAD